MLWVFFTAFGVGGATIIGVFAGLILKEYSERTCCLLLSFAAGIMLSAAMIGLILPAFEGNTIQMLLATIGVISGTLCLKYAQRLTVYLEPLLGIHKEDSAYDLSLQRTLLFVTGIAIHNLPEGLAAGVSFGCDNFSDAILITGGIALQNIPEGIVIIPPMLKAGIETKHAVICGIITGAFEIIGTFIGYFIISSSTFLLPFCLGFAGGTMLYIISDEMIPDINSKIKNSDSTYFLIAGFCVVLFCHHYL